MRAALLILAAACVALVRGDVDSSATKSRPRPTGIEPRDATNYDLTGRIVNGTKATLGQFPYQMSLRRSYSSRHFCGGALVTSKHVITAAHCMYMNRVKIQPWTIVVVGGELQLSKSTPTGQRRGVSTFILHPEFDLNTLHNDLAVLILQVPFVMTPELHGALFPTGPLEHGSICQVAGWGYPAENIPIANNDLMYIDLPIMPDDMCRVLLENVTDFPPGMFCAGYLEGGQDACQGDSGGGLICNGVLTGIVSGGKGCAHPRLPGVYSDVYHYRDWLLMCMEQPEYLSLRWPSAADKTTASLITICLLVLLGLLRP